MPRADGRIEPGQKLTSAISARAWNRAQEAADIVLGTNGGISGGPVNVFALPCVKVRLPHVGYFGEVRYPKGGSLGDGASLLTAVQVSFGSPNDAVGQFSENEKKIISRTTVPTARVDAFSGDQPKLLICTGNRDNQYAIAGFCITRVRVFNYKHSCARSPVDHVNVPNCEGLLDSSFWGPAKVAGYFASDGSVVHPATITTTLVYPNYDLRWALVCL